MTFIGQPPGPWDPVPVQIVWRKNRGVQQAWAPRYVRRHYAQAHG